MEIIVKVRFNGSKERIEKFGNNRYLMYLTFEEDNDSEMIIRELLSRYMGSPTSRISFQGKNYQKDWVFEVS